MAYETDPVKLKKESKNGKSGSLQEIDLTRLFPDFFTKSRKMPRRMEQAARQCLESAMAAHGGLYAFTEKGIINIWFREYPPALGKSKLDAIKESIKQAMTSGEAANSESARVAAANGSGAAAQKKKQTEPQILSRMIQEGLPENPDPQTFRMWAQRVLQDLHHQSREQFLPQDLLKLGSQYETVYTPLWYADRQMINGSFCALQGAPVPKSGEEKARQSFALLLGGVFAIVKMLHEDSRAMVFVPLSAPLLLDKELYDLYLACLRKLTTPIRACLCLVLRGQSQAPFSDSMKQIVTELQEQCKGIVIETSLLAPDKYSFEGFKPLGYLLSFTGLGLEPERVKKMMGKAVDKYKGEKCRLIAPDIGTEEEFEAVLAGGAGFVTGPLLGTQTGRCYIVEKLPREAIG